MKPYNGFNVNQFLHLSFLIHQFKYNPNVLFFGDLRSMYIYFCVARRHTVYGEDAILTEQKIS